MAGFKRQQRKEKTPRRSDFQLSLDRSNLKSFKMNASSEPYPIYLGVWTNWSRGSVMGLTLTMTRNNADLLIALVAFYVAFVGGRIWRVFCFACHSIVSSKSNKPRHGTYHQHQVIMRNSPSAPNAVVALVQVLWAWRSTKGRPTGVLVITLFLAAFFSLAFLVASSFSSRLSTVAGDEVLIARGRCGWLDQGEDNFDGFIGVYSPHISKLFLNAANYAQECYGENRSGLLGCNKFVQQALPFTVDTNAPCPFEPGLCRTNTSNIRLDTGLIDSNDHIGLNAKPEDRVLWRRVLHCAPLVTEGYKTRQSQSFDLNNKRVSKPIVRYHYGKSAALDAESAEDFTYEYVDETQWDFNMSLTDNSYSLSSTAAYSLEGGFLPSTGGYAINGTRAPIGFVPISGLTSVMPQADVSILFLSSNGMPFINATTDEWYSATTAFRNMSLPGWYNTSAPAYLQDEPASPLGCLEQRQFCSPNNLSEDGQPMCTPLTGMMEVPYVTEPIIKNPEREMNYFKWFYNVGTSPQDTMNHLVSFLHATVLQSRFSVSRNAQGPLPDNQWQVEVQHMFSTLLASLQQSFVHAAAVPAVPGLDEFIIGPGSEQTEKLCQNQVCNCTENESSCLYT